MGFMFGSLGAKVTVLGLAGDDGPADVLEQRLTAAGAVCRFTRIADCPTITKLRVLSRHQQLIRLDFEEDFEQADYAGMQADYAQLLQSVDAVILSDYGKGALRQLGELITAAREAGKSVLVDRKGNDFSILQGATRMTHNFMWFKGGCDIGK